MNKCVVCGKDSEGNRYCSNKCKQQAYRNRGVTSGNEQVTKPDTVLPDKPSEALPDDMYSETVSWADIHSLPVGVSRPTCRPSDSEPNGLDWWNTPAYAMVTDRLLTCDPAGLQAEGIFVPAWAWQRQEMARSTSI